MIELHIEPKPDAVLRHVDYGDYPLPTSVNIAAIFEDMYRQLLILGAPGSGKTTLLLELTRALIQRATEDDTQPMPVVFNLASWAVKAESLENWLIERLQLEYQNPPKVAADWVHNGELLLMLDGLDEVSLDKRDACVEAINNFRLKYPQVDMAVCSRIADYTMLTHQLDLSGAIVLQPLTPEQVESYLAQPDLANLREFIRTNMTARQMAETPFLLTTMIATYQGQPPPQKYESLNDGRASLFEAYVAKQFQGGKGYTLEQTRHYLAWLARTLKMHSQIVFYIEKMQKEWLPQKLEMKNLRSVGFTVIIGAVICAANGFWVGGLPGGITGLVVGGIVTAIVFWGRARINLVDFSVWDWKRSIRRAIVAAIFGVCVAIILGWLGTWIGSLAIVILITLIALPVTKPAYVAGTGPVMGLPIIILVMILADAVEITIDDLPAIGAGFGLIGGILGGLFLHDKTAKIETWTIPNQGIWKTARTASLLALVLPAVVFVVGGTRQVIPLLALFSWLFSGGGSVVQHVLLRRVLYGAGYIPWNYARFLDYAAEIGLLRKVGGGYIFAHRYLLDYFAGLDG